MRGEVSPLKGPWLAEGWATPLASSVTVPDPTEVPVQVLEVVKNVNVTVPVGEIGRAPCRALSCIVDPAGTDVTTARLALGISVTTVGVSAVTVSGSQGLSVAA